MPGVIKINPDVMNDKRDALAVAWNEGLRILMEDIGFDPQFEITPEQESFFAGTAYAEGGGVAAEKGGAVLGRLDPATWGGSGGKATIRAETKSETLAKERAKLPVLEYRGPGLRDIVNAGPATGNIVLDTVTAAIGVGTTFGPALAAAARGTMGGLTKAAGASVGSPKVAHEFEGREISAERAKLLEDHTQQAERAMTKYAPNIPRGITYDPGRAYRRVGGTPGLRDLVAYGGLAPSEDAKVNPLGAANAIRFSGVYMNAGSPAAAYSGPINVEMRANDETDPNMFHARKGPFFKDVEVRGFMEAKPAGTELKNVSRIFHDDGTVIYSKARDGLPGLLPAVNQYLKKSGEHPVGVLGESRRQRDAAMQAWQLEEEQRQAALTARMESSGWAAKLRRR